MGVNVGIKLSLVKKGREGKRSKGRLNASRRRMSKRGKGRGD